MSKIVVIGGSAGAINALKLILPTLPHDFPAAILIVTHIGSQKSMLAEILGRRSTMPVRHAIDGEPIIPGRVLVAPPDEHLMVMRSGDRAYARLVHGPKENHSRPAVDPLFRTAASAFGSNTIGLVLSGYLDDGTVGLQAVKACGGVALVQDPAESDASDMPASAIKYADVDRVLGVNEIGPALLQLAKADVQQSAAGQQDVMSGKPNWIDIESRITAQDSDMDDLEKIGKLSSLTCPECNGALWEIRAKGPIRYRCHTGHAFTARVLEALQSDAVEDAIWSAIRALHEQERLFSKMAEKELQTGRQEGAAEYQAMAARARTHSQALRDVIAARALVSHSDAS
ncbi:chemotaxis protein CheB [Massilia sp. LjRoot122]|uniref:chemotaxis protein CheB n=1 Tax=Massilia sp. LjRoot122 TaxID=3342257 RepID=UPI003ED0A74E